MSTLTNKQKSFLKRFVPISAFVGGLCCFAPVVLVLLGLSTVSFASSLSDTLYYGHRWAFRGMALFFLGTALLWYFYKKEKICTVDSLKRNWRKVINFVLITVVIAGIAYIIWLYVIVEIIGLLLGIWGI